MICRSYLEKKFRIIRGEAVLEPSTELEMSVARLSGLRVRCSGGRGGLDGERAHRQ